MGTKLHGDSCYDNALPEEPMFVLLARDKSAPRYVRLWALQRRALIETGEKPLSDMAQVLEAEAHADKMEAWRFENDGAWRV